MRIGLPKGNKEKYPKHKSNKRSKQIGIFRGKKGKYNRFILKALYEEGFLSAWKIAKYICKNDPEKRKKNWYQEAHKINSVLTRKNGRLEDLLNKEYVLKTPAGYHITFPKGYCATLLFLRDFTIPKIDFSDPVLLLQMMKVQYSKHGLEIDETLKESLELSAELTSKEESYNELKKATKDVLDFGLDLDVINNEEFGRILGTHFETMWQQQLKKGKTENKILENPELRERYLNLLIKLRKKMERHTEEALKAMESIESYLQKFKKKN